MSNSPPNTDTLYIVVYRTTKTGAHRYVRAYTPQGANISLKFRGPGATYQEVTNTLRIKSTTDLRSIFGGDLKVLD